MTAHTFCTVGCVSEDCSHLMRQQDAFGEVGCVPLCTKATLLNDLNADFPSLLPPKQLYRENNTLNWRASGFAIFPH